MGITDRLQMLQRQPRRSCYICQFHGSLLPEQHNPVERGKVNETVGTCHKCSVWACAWHGTRYGVFECAKCRHGTAVSDVITNVNVVGFEAVLASAYFPGVLDNVTSDVIDAAINLLLGAHPEPQDYQLPMFPRTERPNLITNLAGEIARYREEHGRNSEPSTATDADVAAVSAVVRSIFANRMLRREHDDESVKVLAVALQMAYELAGEQFPEPGPRELFTQDWKPPWQVTHPLLLHPAVWLLATACELVRPGGPDE